MANMHHAQQQQQQHHQHWHHPHPAPNGQYHRDKRNNNNNNNKKLVLPAEIFPRDVLALFAPRPPLPYLRCVGQDPDIIRPQRVGGVAELLARLREEKESVLVLAGQDTGKEGNFLEDGEEPASTLAEETKRQIYREERQKKKEEDFQKAKDTYKPADDPHAEGDPYKTLFIARMNKSTTEDDLRREFEVYGTVERVRIVTNKLGRSRGYGFVVFERERAMKAAYKATDALELLGKKVLVDIERGRTVRGWKPRRLGGGLGGRPKPVVQEPYDTNRSYGDWDGKGNNFRGGRGYRGGNRGGYRGGRGGYRNDGYGQRNGHGHNNGFGQQNGGHGQYNSGDRNQSGGEYGRHDNGYRARGQRPSSGRDDGIGFQQGNRDAFQNGYVPAGGYGDGAWHNHGGNGGAVGGGFVAQGNGGYKRQHEEYNDRNSKRLRY